MLRMLPQCKPAGMGSSGSRNLGRRAAGEAYELGIGRGEHRVRVAGCRPDLVIVGERDVDKGPYGIRVSHRRDPANDETGTVADEIGIGAPNFGGADEGRDLCGVHTVRAAGEHEQRLTVGREHQGVGDLADIDTDLVGGLLRGAGRDIQNPDLGRRTRRGQRRPDPVDGRVIHGRGTYPSDDGWD